MRSKIPVIICCTIFLMSCSKNFLNVPPQGDGIPSVNSQTALDEVVGAYNALITPDPTQSGFGNYDVHGVYFITVTNIMSDDADKGSYPIDQPLAAQFDNFNISSDNTYLDGLWSGYYAGISRTNRAISDLSTVNLDHTLVTTRTAEMRFLRAYFYFNLV